MSSRDRRANSPRHLSARAGLLSALALALALAPACGLAALGEPVASLQGEAIRHAASVRTGVQGLVQVHVMRMSDGSEVRQFSGSDGIVFKVSWSTRGKPRLDVWLGAFFEAYAKAASEEQRKQGGVRHALRMETGDLVVQSYGHTQAFVGQAWLRSRQALAAGASAR